MNKNLLDIYSVSLKHNPDPAIRLNHNNSQNNYSGRFYLWFTAGWLREESAPHGIQALFTRSRVYKMSYGLSVWPQHHTVL